jgi:hypothetical protein
MDRLNIFNSDLDSNKNVVITRACGDSGGKDLALAYSFKNLIIRFLGSSGQFHMDWCPPAVGGFSFFGIGLHEYIRG